MADSSQHVFTDAGYILDTGGFDAACQGNESLQWRPVGTTGSSTVGGTFTLSPSSGQGTGGQPISATVGTPLSMQATLMDAANLLPLPSVALTFTVMSGPNAGLTRQAVTDNSGTASFSYTSMVAGTDVIQAAAPNASGGSFTSNPVTVTWTLPATPTSPAGGFPVSVPGNQPWTDTGIHVPSSPATGFSYRFTASGTVHFTPSDAGTGPDGDTTWAQSQLAERDVLEERPEAAIDRLLPLLDRPGLEEVDVTVLLPRLAWAYLDMGDDAQAAQLAAHIVTRAHNQHHRIALADALWVLGMVATRREHWDEARRALEEALTVTRGMPYRYAEARIQEAYGLMHARQGEPDRAREILEGALALFQRLGARRDAERLAQSIVALH